MNLRYSVIQPSEFVSHHNVIWVESLFWAALLQSMTQDPRGFCPVAWPSQCSLSPALCMEKKEQGKAHPLLAAPDQNYASSFSFISPKAIIQASVWYDRNLGPGVFPFPTVSENLPRSTHESIAHIGCRLLNSATLLQPCLALCMWFLLVSSLGPLRDELFAALVGTLLRLAIGWELLELLDWGLRTMTLVQPLYLAALVSLCSLSDTVSPCAGHYPLMYC